MKKKIKRRSYKLWIQIEEHIEYEDGSDRYRDINDEDGVAIPLTIEMDCTKEKAIGMAEQIESHIFPFNS